MTKITNKKVLEKRHKYYLKNREKILKRWKEKYEDVEYRSKRIKYNREYYKLNRKKLIKYVTDRRKSSPVIRLAKNLRTRIRNALKYNIQKSERTFDLLGCSITEFKSYISSKFQPGMTWENYGKWHIDHIIPVKVFDLSLPIEQKQCFHFTNMQPLWAYNNYVKGAKIENH